MVIIWVNPLVRRVEPESGAFFGAAWPIHHHRPGRDPYRRRRSGDGRVLDKRLVGRCGPGRGHHLRPMVELFLQSQTHA